MEVVLAWGIYLALGVVCVALAWGWAAPRLPRRIRLAALGLVAGFALVALAVTSQIPHDYRPDDLGEYGRGSAAVIIQLLVALLGGAAALVAVGRRRPLDASLTAAGAYLAGVGLVLYLMMNGRPVVQAPALVLVGTAVAVSAACSLAGLPRRLAPVLGLPAGLVTVIAVEALRGAGSRGAGPAAAPRDVLSLAGIEALVLLLGGIVLARAHGRLLARPFVLAGAALAGTTLVLVLRGVGEWAPGPAAGSTTLYGVPLTMLAVALCLAMLEPHIEQGRTPTEGRPRHRHLTPALPLVAVLLLLVVLRALWHPAAEACAAVPYAEASPLTPQGPAWAQSPYPAAPRGAPDVAAFDGPCKHRTTGLSQIVYVTYPSCKWAQVDANYPLVQASGIVRRIDMSHGDSPWIHKTHDLGIDVALDPASAWLAVDGTPGTVLHMEAEAGSFPLPYRPVAGDRVTVAGRWIYDCGHDPKTEIHPAAVVASEHDEWRADFPGGPRQVRVLQVWMNSEPGVVHVPLAPLDLHVNFPAQRDGQAGTPVVRVAAGEPSAVQWTIESGAGSPTGTQAAVHITPPTSNVSAYFELLLGYEEAAPAPGTPVSYTVVFDRLVVLDDLRREARNTTGVPGDLINPQLGFAGTGNWTMQAIVGHVWRGLLDNAPVESGRAYSLAAVPPVPILSPGDERLSLSITGYAENDPSDGVQLASGSITGAALLSWDLGRLADLCCGREQTFTPPHGAWTLSYHLTRSGP